MKTSKKGIELIKEFEGLELKPYRDSAGYLTIGYGHLINPFEKLNKCESIEKDEADLLLLDDIKIAEYAVNHLIAVKLNQNQYDALVSFTFNLGAGNLRTSTLRKLLNKEKYKEAANQFERWVYAGGRKLNGLIRRRKAEKELFNFIS